MRGEGQTTVQMRNERNTHLQRLTTEKDRKQDREMKELNNRLRQFTKIALQEQQDRAAQNCKNQT